MYSASNDDSRIRYHFRGTKKQYDMFVDEIGKNRITDCVIRVDDNLMNGIKTDIWLSTDSDEVLEKVQRIRKMIQS